ncbi:MAG: hypothetical protein CVV33_09490, partial [Methanomicrobiales archaeon HGW-Methanomicrobiales-4]
SLNILLIGGAVSGVISPAAGAIGHQVATVFVLLNSLRLVRGEPSDKGVRQPVIPGLPSDIYPV